MTNRAINDQSEYFERNPPGCLSGFTSKSIKFDGIEFDGHGFSGSLFGGLSECLNIVFKVECSCGGSSFSLIAKSGRDEIWQHDETVIAEQYTLLCNKCGTNRILYNPSKHGYDPEVMLLEGLMRDGDDLINEKNNHEQKEQKCNCKNCTHSSFEFFTRFEYSDDLFEDEVFRGREQDFFSWFTGIGKCINCSTLNLFINFECS